MDIGTEIAMRMREHMDDESWARMFIPDGSARQARWMCGDGWIVGYTTERIKGGPFNGRFAAMAYKPVGKGARSRRAGSWKRVYWRGFSTRKAARARAERMYYQHKAR